MVLTVQESSGLYFAVQYDGTNGQAIADTLNATDYSNVGGVLGFRASIMRAGGLLTSGHRFRVEIGQWLVWAEEGGTAYVIAPPLSDELFNQQYQIAASVAEVAALSAQVTALALQVGSLATDVTALDGQVVVLSNSVADLDTDLTALTAVVTAQGTSIGTLQSTAISQGNAITALQGTVSAQGTALTTLSGTVTAQGTSITTLQGQVNTINTVSLPGKSNTGHTHAGPDIDSGILPYQRLAGTIAENATIVLYNRPTLVTPGTALDSWQWRYNGVRTVYGNEYNCLRVRGVPDDQVPARFMPNAARDGLVTAILQATLSDAASHLFQVLGNGDILGPGGASMLPTAPTAVTFNGVAGTANATTISDGVSSGTPYAVTTTLHAANNRVFLDGSVANPTGVSINAQTVLFTVTAAHRPASWTQRAGRTSTGLAVRITVKPDGTVVIDQALAAGATLSFDGCSWRKA